jgi:hypothetical protein
MSASNSTQGITEPTSTPAPGEPSPAAQPGTPTQDPNVAQVATPTAPVVTPATPAPIDLDAPILDWDADPATASPAPIPVVAPTISPSIDFEAISTELGLQGIKTREDFIKAASGLKQRAESIGKLPEDLAKAVEIASNGGNYLEYLNVSVIDWNREDPVVLYENYVIDRYTDSNGNVDSEKVDKILDSINDAEKELRGRELQNQYITIQRQQKQSLEQQAFQRKSQFENAVKSAIASVDSVSGFKLSQAHKNEIVADILSGADLKHSDLKSRVEAAALRKYWTKMDEYRKSQIKNSVLRQTLESATFPSITPTAAPAAPAATSDRYDWKNYIDEISKRRGL